MHPERRAHGVGHRPNFSGSLRRAAQNQQTAQRRTDDCPQRIECLREIQAARRRLLRSQRRHIRIRRNLQNRHPGGQDDQCAQKQRKRRHARRGYEQKRAHAHREQSRHHRQFVTNLFN